MVNGASEEIVDANSDEGYSIVVKPMEIDDIAPAFHLGEKLFTLSAMPNLYRIWDEYEIIDFYHDSSEYCFSAFADGKFVGFLLGTVIEKKTNRKYGYLVWTGVNKEYGGMGVASMLFEKFKEVMMEEKATMIIVDTQADNHNAIEFFKSKGFGNPQDHVYLTLNINENNFRKGNN
jgi:ribosomal protein S18 acetylase RimI-like enzyme